MILGVKLTLDLIWNYYIWSIAKGAADKMIGNWYSLFFVGGGVLFIYVAAHAGRKINWGGGGSRPGSLTAKIYVKADSDKPQGIM